MPQPIKIISEGIRIFINSTLLKFNTMDLKLVGSRLIKINAERNSDFNGKLEIKTDIKINTLAIINWIQLTAQSGYLEIKAYFLNNNREG